MELYLWTLIILSASQVAMYATANERSSADNYKTEEMMILFVCHSHGIPYLSLTQISNPVIANDDDCLKLTHTGNHDDSDKPGYYLDEITLKVQLQNESLVIDLKKKRLYASVMFVEWNEGNVTSIQTLDEDCFYQGKAQHRPESHVALSICNGLTGLIELEEQILYIDHDDRYKDAGYHRVRAKPHARYNQQSTGTASSSTNQTRSRQPRDTKTKYMELMMATDSTVIKYHGEDNYEKYLLALLNVMNLAYSHPTLGYRIEVVLVRMTVIDDHTARRLITNKNIQMSLRRFCQWAATYVSSDLANPRHHDMAVYITKKDIGPAGYAPVTGLCNPLRSCAIVKDEGITSAFVLAHEVAHTFGLVHDGQGNTCYGGSMKNSIMASVVQSNFAEYFWSPCSQTQMYNNIPYLTCLNDEPKQLMAWKSKTPQEPLGSNWSLDQQCQQEYEDTYILCHMTAHIDPCRQLWCAKRSDPRICHTKQGPALPGTPCGREKRCVNHTCSYKIGLVVVHGQWSSWGDWGDCSTPCNVGVQYRTRECNNPSPDFGGKDCKGEAEQLRLCNVHEPCTYPRDMRQDQCDHFNTMYQMENWRPFQPDDKSKQCMLRCSIVETGDMVEIDGAVVDGLPCTYEDKTRICIRGQCTSIGCDGELNSKKEFDQCGVCQGNNTACEPVTGEYKMSKRPATGQYETVVTLPVGARNIEVKEVQQTPQTLVLQSEDKDILLSAEMGKRNQQHKFPKQIIIDGVRFVYQRDGYLDIFVCKGPLIKNYKILLQVVDGRYPTTVTYTYTMPTELTSDVIGDSAIRGTTVILDKRTLNETLTTSTMATTDSSTWPSTTATTTATMTTTTTTKSETSPSVDPVATFNSTTTTEDANQTSAYTSQDPNNTTLPVTSTMTKPTRVISTSSSAAVVPTTATTPRPSTPTQRRTTPPIRTRWRFTRWSKCSATCGIGVYVAQYACVTVTGGRTVSDVLCTDKPRPEQTADCSRPQCYTTAWVAGEWGSCSKTCGNGGTEKRRLVCKRMNEDNTVSYAPKSECDAASAPNTTQICQEWVPCPGKWATTSWSKCSASCGSGVQVRHVLCSHPEDGNYYSCDGQLPENSRTCREAACPDPESATCKGDKSRLCKIGATAKTCKNAGFRNVCCESCEKYRRF